MVGVEGMEEIEGVEEIGQGEAVSSRQWVGIERIRHGSTHGLPSFETLLLSAGWRWLLEAGAGPCPSIFRHHRRGLIRRTVEVHEHTVPQLDIITW